MPAKNKALRPLCWGDYGRICETLGLSLGEKRRGDDSSGLAFTVCGGQLVNGEKAPAWLAARNGEGIREIALEAIRRAAVRPVGRWQWETVNPAADAATGTETEAQLRAEVERLKDALHTDQTGLAAAMEHIHRTAQGYGWIAQGRGPYEWDDPEYRKEMGRMVTEIIKLAANALQASGDRAHVFCCKRQVQRQVQRHPTAPV